MQSSCFMILADTRCMRTACAAVFVIPRQLLLRNLKPCFHQPCAAYWDQWPPEQAHKMHFTNLPCDVEVRESCSRDLPSIGAHSDVGSVSPPTARILL